VRQLRPERKVREASADAAVINGKADVRTRAGALRIAQTADHSVGGISGHLDSHFRMRSVSQQKVVLEFVQEARGQ
jgi:hypothetical protein